ncbi:uncharacterized protein KY384_005053 [Bacidia gigantensis]|uniref:uncharacterized protein n=1 Tax=Bacidia gigantensis TaxID=2732470 RepID=UPI001D052355|nr:uncharacterized protein KY384_005053 [Bacidia gigantensis]KAG8530550.1 hypothetical protein KY384_005053 [Bacidia gigantensis]
MGRGASKSPIGTSCTEKVGTRLHATFFQALDMRLDSKPLTELDKKFEDTTFARKYVESVGSKASARFDRIKKRAKWEFELD